MSPARTVRLTSEQVAAAIRAAIEGIKRQREDGSMYDAIEAFRRIGAHLGVDLDEDGELTEARIVEGRATMPFLIVDEPARGPGDREPDKGQ